MKADDRSCAFPPHPENSEPVAATVTDSALSRFRRWIAHAPAERAPLPAIPAVWTATEILHLAGTPALYPGVATAAAVLATGWLRRGESEHPRLAAAELAATTGAVGAWVTIADAAGPLAGGFPFLLTLGWLAGTGGGYWWLRRHEAVRAARQRRDDAVTWAERKAEWHAIAHLVGLGGYHLQKITPTELGEDLLIVTAPGGTRASGVARNSDAIAEELAHLWGLPYGRVDINGTEYPGQLVIRRRDIDPSVKGEVYHPMTSPWPVKDPSPFAAWFPESATIRDPVPVGFVPEDGSPMTITLWDKLGGKAIGVYGGTGSGKSNLLNGVRERVTAMKDAVLIQLNGAHMGDEITWEPVSAATACGPAASDEGVCADIAEVLAWLCELVTDRSATLATTGHSTFQPTAKDPAYVVMCDEVDEIVKNVDGAAAALEFLASKERKSAVCLILATQRPTQRESGGGMVRANLAQVVIGNMNRATENRHATGAESEIPDITEYSRGESGFFQVWRPSAKQIEARGRTFLLGVPPDELTYCRTIVNARKDTRPRQPMPGRELVLDGGQGAATAAAQQTGTSDMRARLAAAKALSDAQPGPAAAAPERPAAAPVPAVRLPLEIPHADGQRILAMLAEPDGVTSSAAGLAIGKSKSVAHTYLSALESRGIAVRTGSGPASRYRLRTDHQDPAREPAQPPPYVTVHDLAAAVHNGLVDNADEDARAVLDQVRQLVGQPDRPHLAVVPPSEEGNAS